MKLTVTLSLALLATVSLRAEAPSIQGTLPEDYVPGLKPLLVTAVERSPNTISASIAVAQQEAAKIVAYSALWPSLNANSNYSVTTETVSRTATSTEPGLYYGASINQPLFQWGALKNGAQVGDLGIKIAQRQYAEAYRLLAISIREQYLGLIAKKVMLRNARFGLKMAQEALALQEDRLKTGAISEAQLSDFRMAVEQSQLDTDRATEDLAYTKRVFTRLVGIDDLDDESIPLMVPHPGYSGPVADAILAGFVGDGIESTFQNEVYRMTLQQADKNYSIAAVRLLPKLSASASYNYSDLLEAGVGSVLQVKVATEIYGVAASWNIFDGFATRGAKMQARETKRYYEQLRKTYVDSTVDSITYMRHQIDFSSRALSISEVHNALIAAEVKQLADDRKLGYASQASIDAGVQTLYATEFQMAYARSDFLGRWTEFISLAGLDPAITNISPRYVR